MALSLSFAFPCVYMIVFAQKKETSQISIDVKPEFSSKESITKVETYDSSPKANGRISVSPIDSDSFKESHA